MRVRAHERPRDLVPLPISAVNQMTTFVLCSRGSIEGPTAERTDLLVATPRRLGPSPHLSDQRAGWATNNDGGPRNKLQFVRDIYFDSRCVARQTKNHVVTFLHMRISDLH